MTILLQFIAYIYEVCKLIAEYTNKTEYLYIKVFLIVLNLYNNLHLLELVIE